MYDDREKIVKPTAFIKWILKHKNPIACRNIPYLFSMANNKELRAVDSGINLIYY
jgi:hypothetical protein